MKNIILIIILTIFSPTLYAMNISTQIKTFNHISITTKNIQPLLEFYQNKIGCELLLNGGERSGKGISDGIGLKDVKMLNYKLRFPNSDVILELIEMENPKSTEGNKEKINSTGYTHFCLMVNDIDKTYSILKDNNVKTISPTVEVAQTKAKFFYAYDTDGNIIEIVQSP